MRDIITQFYSIILDSHFFSVSKLQNNINVKIYLPGSHWCWFEADDIVREREAYPIVSCEIKKL